MITTRHCTQAACYHIWSPHTPTCRSPCPPSPLQGRYLSPSCCHMEMFKNAHWHTVVTGAPPFLPVPCCKALPRPRQVPASNGEVVALSPLSPPADLPARWRERALGFVWLLSRTSGDPRPDQHAFLSVWGACSPLVFRKEVAWQNTGAPGPLSPLCLPLGETPPVPLAGEWHVSHHTRYNVRHSPPGHSHTCTFMWTVSGGEPWRPTSQPGPRSFSASLLAPP